MATAQLKCGQCGTAVEWDSEGEDDSPVVCQSCGKPAGSVGEINTKVSEAVRKKALDLARNAFKRR